ncbi:peptidoglycan/xylan/chitin deacetylase (PgdA/CDA1 family) [Arthrobacter sp. W4I7]|nr:peptidoglycan/xylan/chitin deacetylase (PgdA/CDA1 family) [Arthrobacter sp. W4I7]
MNFPFQRSAVFGMAALPVSATVLALGAVIPAVLAGAAPALADQTTTAIVDSTRHEGKYVSLTFDDGPDPVNTPKLLAVLEKHHVKATFCLWGDHVKQYPEIVRQIADAGHMLCNHTMHHDDMGAWSAEAIRADLEETSGAIRQAVPEAEINYFRAPYGSWGQTPQVAADMGMQPLGWATAIGDWEPPGTAELVRRLKEGITPGGVVLMHDGGGDRTQTVEAVDQIIPELRSDGWRFDKPARRG